MCRWLAYSGSPVLVEDLLYKPEHSLIVQSMHSTLGAEATNGDGFGVGWYGVPETPGVFRSIEPAWNDRNLRDLAAHISSPRVFAHIRAAIGSPVQQTNCHPFRQGRWLWMHNGFIDGFRAMKRDLAMAVDPDRYADIEGTTDSELLFFLALTFGLEDDPPAAVARAVGLVEETAQRHGIGFPMQGTLATTDGADHVGLPLLQRGTVPVAVPQHRRLHAEAPVPGEPCAARAVRRRAHRRLRAAGGAARSLARGAGGQLRGDP